MEIVEYITLGLAGGTLAGMFGIGGAIMVVPALIYVFGFDQKMAQGTTLAMLIPPTGLLAAWQYYQDGNINIRVAVILCVGMFAGGYIGGAIAHSLSTDLLRKLFGLLLLVVAVRMIIGK
ncbi:MAG TPA: sulfite exporter TauE/SafE family protein [Bacteroidota bacterium]|nr:sulfite exporter TauE/SafE family protein [Bacteroidota bacterium]